jgi:hypothetical protein
MVVHRHECWLENFIGKRKVVAAEDVFFHVRQTDNILEQCEAVARMHACKYLDSHNQDR